VLANVATTTVSTPDGRELCVEISGQAGERTILLCAGTPNSRHIYEPWAADAAARGVQMIGYDRPGYGSSTANPGYSVADQADDIRAIAHALGIRRLAVWGFSGGGPYTLACAALLPDLVVAVATVGSVAPWDASGLDYLAGMGERNVESIQLYFADPVTAREQGREQREQLLETTPETLLEAWKSLLSPADLEALSGEFAASVVRSIHDGLAPGEQGWWDDGVAHMAAWGFELGSIRVPVKVLHGRQDRFVPFQHGQWLAEHIPGAESHLTEADGHLTLLVNEIPAVHEWLLSHF
jgi:pimeloyl-ACP methyl ester carboxylesterase